MKRILSLLALFIVSLQYTYAQKKSCCSASANGQFTALANDADFKNMHPYPVSSDLPAEGEMIKYPTPDGATASAFIVRPNMPGTKYLLVFHEWWGLNNNIKKEAIKYFDDLEGVTVMALDLYDGLTGDNREKAAELMQNALDIRIENIIKGAIQYAGENAEIATVGWCFGGGWSLQATIMLEDRAEACIVYYGMPEKDLNRLQKLHAPVLGFFALQDKWITPEVVSDFESRMKEADKELRVLNFEADHAFANPSNPNYNRTAATKAYQTAIRFLKDNL